MNVIKSSNDNKKQEKISKAFHCHCCMSERLNSKVIKTSFHSANKKAHDDLTSNDRGEEEFFVLNLGVYKMMRMRKKKEK